MRTLWYIARKDLMQVIRDRSGLVLLLVVPLVLITVVGLTLGTLFGSGSTQLKIRVAVSNQDTNANAFLGTTIVKALKIDTDKLVITVDEYHTSADVTREVSALNNAADVGVVIPSGASETLLSDLQQGATPKNLVQVYTLPNNTDARVNVVQSVINNVMQSQLVGSAGVKQVMTVCNQPGNHCTQSTIDSAAISTTIANAGAAADQAVETLTAGKAIQTNSFDQTVPGYAVFFCLFGLNAVAATILQEKEDGTFRRLLIAPIQKYALLGGKALAQFLLTLTQLMIFFLVGYFVFKMHVSDWPAVLLLLIGTSFAATGLGMVLVSVVKSRRQINPLITLITLATAAIGGSWWPLYIEPVWMQQIAKIGITAWAMEGLNNSMMYGRSFMEVLPNILALLAYGTICFVLALRFFRFTEKTASA
jgi:ABC-2 type transport system permease protein